MNKIIFLLLSVLILSCINDPEESIIKEYVKIDGEKLLYKEYGYTILDGDTLINGYMKAYYPNGNIKTITAYKNGLKNGIEKSYYKNGKLNWTQEYNNDTLSGNIIKYYDNGKLEYVFEYKKGELINEGRMYYENGAIKNYLYYDPNRKGKVAFKVYYNIDSTISKLQGDPIMSVIKSKEEFNIGDNFSALINYAKPDLFKTLISVTLSKQTKQNAIVIYKKREVPYLFKKSITNCNDSLLIVDIKLVHNIQDTSFLYKEKAFVSICGGNPSKNLAN
ncbi:MAG: hypothetical protein PF448_12120 [Bacteroidales bacterium]|jgi:hypothetical protein|nr:hypothetical protein [Bacteroidales bacterium]